MANTELNSFVDYVYDFYGAGGIYEEFFANTKPVTKEEILAIAIEHSKDDFWCDGDSADRELVRDAMLNARGIYN